MDLQRLKKQIRQNRYLNPFVMVVGIFFVFLGLLGFILPVIPGIVFLAIGLVILGEEFFLTRWILSKLPQKNRNRVRRSKEEKDKD